MSSEQPRAVTSCNELQISRSIISTKQSGSCNLNAAQKKTRWRIWFSLIGGKNYSTVLVLSQSEPLPKRKKKKPGKKNPTKTGEHQNHFVHGREALFVQCWSGLAHVRTKNNATTARKSILLQAMAISYKPI